MFMRRYLPAVTAVALFLAAASANWNDTSTGIALRKLPQFPLKKIRSGFLQAGSRVMFDGITAVATSDPREVRLSGIGKRGKRWEAHMFGLDEVWRGDLDGNGTQDYALFSGGPLFNGRITPLYSLIILLMDQDGLPIPFFTVVYKGEDGDGIRHVVELNHDGRAQLLISDYDERVSDPRAGPTCSGHWVNQLYQFKNLEVSELRGEFGGIKFPLIHDWRHGSCITSSYPQPVEPALVRERGTVKDRQVATSIRGVRDAGFWIDIEPVAGCKSVNICPIVYDRATIREMSFLNLFRAYSTELADAIRRDGVPVQIRGLDHGLGNGECSASLIWAEKQR